MRVVLLMFPIGYGRTHTSLEVLSTPALSLIKYIFVYTSEAIRCHVLEECRTTVPYLQHPSSLFELT